MLGSVTELLDLLPEGFAVFCGAIAWYVRMRYGPLFAARGKRDAKAIEDGTKR